MLWLKRLGFVAAGIVTFYGSLWFLIFWLPFASFHIALADAFDGRIEPGQDLRYEFICAGFDCAEVLPRLPRTSALWDVGCTQSMKRDDLRKYGYDVNITGDGACCCVRFGDIGGSEVHIYWTGSRYEILLTEPRMRSVLKTLAERGDDQTSSIASTAPESR